MEDTHSTNHIERVAKDDDVVYTVEKRYIIIITKDVRQQKRGYNLRQLLIKTKYLL